MAVRRFNENTGGNQGAPAPTSRTASLDDYARKEENIVIALSSDDYVKDVARLLPRDKEGQEERFVDTMVAYVRDRRNENWRALVECEIKSILASGLKLASLGMFPSPITGDAYLVPRRDKRSGTSIATPIPGVRGMERLVFTALGDKTQNFQSHCVHRQDQFRVKQGTNGTIIEHEPCIIPDIDSDNSIVAAYATIGLSDGRAHSVVLPIKVEDLYKDTGRMPPHTKAEYAARRAILRDVARLWCQADAMVQKALHMEAESEAAVEKAPNQTQAVAVAAPVQKAELEEKAGVTPIETAKPAGFKIVQAAPEPEDGPTHQPRTIASPERAPAPSARRFKP